MQPFDKWLLIKPYVLQGMSDYAVSRETGIERCSVWRLRRLYLGNDAVRPPDRVRSPYDWRAIQKRYDEGSSWRQLTEEFGVCNKSIHLDKKRGDLKPGRSLSEAHRIARENGRIKSIPPTEEHRRQTSIRQSLHNSGGKSKWFEVAGIKVQGTWERDLALKFEEWGIAWEKPTRKLAWPYFIDGKRKHYSPDFYLPSIGVWVEVKGHWWGDDMRKMVAVTRRYPRRQIVLVRKKEFTAAMASPSLPLLFRAGQKAASMPCKH